MKSLLILLVSIYAVFGSPVVKRQSGFSLLQPGGNIGCVVTGDKLFINGLFEKELDDDEIHEFNDYHKLKTYLNSRQQEQIQLYSSLSSRLPRAQKFDPNLENSQFQKQGLVGQGQGQGGQTIVPLPKAPPKPSFCNENITTQYVFDGCKIQNNKVYIGGQYARDLTDAEVADLQKFDQKFKVYEKTLRSTMQRQIGQIFGQQFSQLLGGSGFGLGQQGLGQQQGQIQGQNQEPMDMSLDTPEQPKICSLII